MAAQHADLGDVSWNLVYQSRSGPPTQPWLEPDINDLIATLPGEGVEAVVIVPLGFVSDHMEVMWDLDEEARREVLYPMCLRLPISNLPSISCCLNVS